MDHAQATKTVGQPVPKTLKEALLQQFHNNPQGVDLALGDFIIDCIDPSGYIYIFESVIAGAMNTTISKVRDAIAVIQGLEPPGVCARNKMECYILQLRAMKNPCPAALEIVRKYLPLLRNNRYEEIAKLTGRTMDEVLEARDLIRTLVLEPGIQYMQQFKQPKN